MSRRSAPAADPPGRLLADEASTAARAPLADDGALPSRREGNGAGGGGSRKGQRVGAFDGRAALVTGAGLGIGQGIALELARQGARVAVHYGHSAAGAEETVARIVAGGGEAFAVQGDLRFVPDCERVVDAAAARLGGLDVLVNNAGVTRERPFEQTDEAAYDEMFDLNMKGYFFCARRAVPLLARSGRGAIVNITSVHGGGGFPNHAAYAATKGAIVAFTRSLAIDLAPQRIRVNAIAPGIVEVPRYFDIPGYRSEDGARMVPWGRVGAPADIGQAAAFLASDAADFVTGQTLYVDGGTNARMGLVWDQGVGEG
jgi:glucose 1-dehydrogenase/3-oxoacyl-[acyl-carrier protein] reductase